MPNKPKPSGKRNRNHDRAQASKQRAEARSRVLAVTLEKRVEALTELLAEVRAEHAHSVELMAGIDVLLFRRPCAETHLTKWVKMAALPIDVKHGLKLYQMMQQLISIFESKGGGIGPTSRVKPLGSERIKHLTREQQDLESKTRVCFNKSPTLQMLASEVLSSDGKRGYSHRNAVRCIRAVTSYAFTDKDPQRDHMIKTVNVFGAPSVTPARVASDWMSSLALAKIATAEALAAMTGTPWRHLLAEIGRTFTAMQDQAMLPALAEIGRMTVMQRDELLPDFQRIAARAARAQRVADKFAAQQAAAAAIEVRAQRVADVIARGQRVADEAAKIQRRHGPKKT